MDRRALIGLLASAGLGGLTPACKKKDEGGGGPGSGSGKAETGEIVIGHYASMTGNTSGFTKAPSGVETADNEDYVAASGAGSG